MIYFIQNPSDSTIKIGYSANPEVRLRQLQTACAHPLKMLGTIEGGVEREKLIHSILVTHAMEGEWFRPSPEVTGLIGILLENDRSLRDPRPDARQSNPSFSVWRITGTISSGSTASGGHFYAITDQDYCLPDVHSAIALLTDDRYVLGPIDKVEHICDVDTDPLDTRSDPPGDPLSADPAVMSSFPIPTCFARMMVSNAIDFREQCDLIVRLQERVRGLSVAYRASRTEPSSIHSDDPRVADSL